MRIDLPLIVHVVLALVFCISVGISVLAVKYALFSPLPKERGADVFMVLAARGRTDALQQTINGLNWLSESGKMDARIVIADCGLDDYSKALAELLARDNERIAVCPPGELPRLLEERAWKGTESR